MSSLHATGKTDCNRPLSSLSQFPFITFQRAGRTCNVYKVYSSAQGSEHTIAFYLQKVQYMIWHVVDSATSHRYFALKGYYIIYTVNVYSCIHTHLFAGISQQRSTEQACAR